MTPLLRSLFRGSSSVAAAPGERTARTGLQPPKLSSTAEAGVFDHSSTSTWEQFWAAQGGISGGANKDQESIQALLAAQIDWLTGALNLLQPGNGKSTEVDVSLQMRQELSRGKLSEGTINAAVAKVLTSHFWPFVEGPRAAEIRAEYKKHSAFRPAVRLLTGDSRPVPATPPAEVPSDSWTRPTELVAEVLDKLTNRHDLADEDLAARTAEVRKRVYEQQALGADTAAIASIVLDDLDRYIQQQQHKYRVNAKRGVKSKGMIWRSRAVVEICGCQGCIWARASQTPWMMIEKLTPPEVELRRELADELRTKIPRKYLDVLRLELVVAYNLALDTSPYTCHQDRVQSMTSLVISLFDTTSDSPERSYLTGLYELLERRPSPDSRPPLASRPSPVNGSSPASGLTPPSRQIRTWQDAEENAAEWMRYMGHADARVTSGGADGGIDVASQRAVAQVKREAVAAGSPLIQRFYGAADARGDFQHKLFFSGSGYSRAAYETAERLGIALFDYHLDGWIEPANAVAKAILHTAEAG